MKRYERSESKWKKELKDLKKQNKIIYSIAKKSGSHCKIKNIKKIRSSALSAATLPATNWTPITHYPSIATEMSIYGLLDVRK